jgi:predicted small lipoprotein YifL
MRRAITTIAVSAMLIVAVGCGHKSPPASSATDGQNFVNSVKNLPADQRAEYVRAHPDGLRSVMNSGNQDLMRQFRGALGGSAAR